LQRNNANLVQQVVEGLQQVVEGLQQAIAQFESSGDTETTTRQQQQQVSNDMPALY
jgi:DNA-binding ferritin-like protein